MPDLELQRPHVHVQGSMSSIEVILPRLGSFRLAINRAGSIVNINTISVSSTAQLIHSKDMVFPSIYMYLQGYALV